MRRRCTLETPSNDRPVEMRVYGVRCSTTPNGPFPTGRAMYVSQPGAVSGLHENERVFGHRILRVGNRPRPQRDTIAQRRKALTGARGE